MRLRFSPSAVLAVIALVAALGGTAYAAGAFTGKQKKEVGKIATKTFNGLVGNASVKHADTAAKAETAAKADTAATATKATEATRAGTATDAQNLGGAPAGAYQRSLAGACAAPSSLARVTPQGQPQCDASPPVQAFNFSLAANQTRVLDFGAVDLTADCAVAPAYVLKNDRIAAGGLDINFNALLSANGAAAGTVGGTLGPDRTERFPVGEEGRRLEAQFILTPPGSVLTLELHAFNGTGSCEFTGTAVTAAT